LYLLRTGCQWEMLPRECPHESTVRYYRNKWMREGTLEQINGGKVFFLLCAPQFFRALLAMTLATTVQSIRAMG
ncbi:MAG TPA: transposase, partial [Ardenticatenaceae bacterium]|nr:transposase [Ardenticatenaceae bacterium]